MQRGLLLKKPARVRQPYEVQKIGGMEKPILTIF